jgi:hypothetical protein
VTVFGSTLNIAATSPGVSNRSGDSMVTGHSCFAWRAALSGLLIVPHRSVIRVPADDVNGAIPEWRKIQTRASTSPRASHGHRLFARGYCAARVDVVPIAREGTEHR